MSKLTASSFSSIDIFSSSNLIILAPAAMEFCRSDKNPIIENNGSKNVNK